MRVTRANITTQCIPCDCCPLYQETQGAKESTQPKALHFRGYARCIGMPRPAVGSAPDTNVRHAASIRQAKLHGPNVALDSATKRHCGNACLLSALVNLKLQSVRSCHASASSEHSEPRSDGATEGVLPVRVLEVLGAAN